MTMRRLNLEWKGYYIYTWENVNMHAPYNRAGVYKVGVRQSNGNWKIRYVGQANDLDRRLKEHLDFSNEKNECLVEKLRKYECGFCFAKISSQDDRNGSENYLYRFYKPSCNNPDAIPNDSHIEINPR